MSEPSVNLDCRGQACPRPIIELGRHLADVEVGEVITVAADDVAAHHDVPAWARMRGQEFVGEVAAEDGVPVYGIRRLS